MSSLELDKTYEQCFGLSLDLEGESTTILEHYNSEWCHRQMPISFIFTTEIISIGHCISIGSQYSLDNSNEVMRGLIMTLMIFLQVTLHS